MKVGIHAETGLSAIVDWKLGDLRAAGVTFWGYGGSVCHPTHQVQPFVEDAGGAVDVAFVYTPSDPRNAATPASEWSADNSSWGPLPVGVRVTGSKWALVKDRLEACLDSIDLAQYVVARGDSAGRRAPDYIRSRVDKGCFVRDPDPALEPRPVPVVLRGWLVAPWAVFLR